MKKIIAIIGAIWVARELDSQFDDKNPLRQIVIILGMVYIAIKISGKIDFGQLKRKIAREFGSDHDEDDNDRDDE